MLLLQSLVSKRAGRDGVAEEERDHPLVSPGPGRHVLCQRAQQSGPSAERDMHKFPQLARGTATRVLGFKGGSTRLFK